MVRRSGYLERFEQLNSKLVDLLHSGLLTEKARHRNRKLYETLLRGRNKALSAPAWDAQSDREKAKSWSARTAWFYAKFLSGAAGKNILQSRETQGAVSQEDSPDSERKSKSLQSDCLAPEKVSPGVMLTRGDLSGERKKPVRSREQDKGAAVVKTAATTTEFARNSKACHSFPKAPRSSDRVLAPSRMGVRRKVPGNRVAFRKVQFYFKQVNPAASRTTRSEAMSLHQSGIGEFDRQAELRPAANYDQFNELLNEFDSQNEAAQYNGREVDEGLDADVLSFVQGNYGAK